MLHHYADEKARVLKIFTMNILFQNNFNFNENIVYDPRICLLAKIIVNYKITFKLNHQIVIKKYYGTKIYKNKIVL